VWTNFRGFYVKAGGIAELISQSLQHQALATLASLQKKIIRIMVGAHPRTPCRSLFKKLDFACSMPIYIFINELPC
jgi:hypothetical protein